MKKPAKTGRSRYPVDKEPHPFITTAEARAEASCMAVSALLKRIPQSICKGVMAECYSEADRLSIDAITEEVECLFADVPFAPPTR